MKYFDCKKISLLFFSSPYGEDAASASLNDLENQQDISPVAGNMGSPSHGYKIVIRFDCGDSYDWNTASLRSCKHSNFDDMCMHKIHYKTMILYLNYKNNVYKVENLNEKSGR